MLHRIISCCNAALCYLYSKCASRTVADAGTGAEGSASGCSPIYELPLKDRAVTETTARKFGEKGAAQAKDTYQKVTVATQEAANVFQNTYSTATQAAQDYNAKVLEFALAYTNAALAYTQELWGVKSPSEFMELSVKHASEQFKMVTNQTKEFAALAQRMPLKTAEPLKVAWA